MRVRSRFVSVPSDICIAHRAPRTYIDECLYVFSREYAASPIILARGFNQYSDDEVVERTEQLIVRQTNRGQNVLDRILVSSTRVHCIYGDMRRHITRLLRPQSNCLRYILNRKMPAKRSLPKPTDVFHRHSMLNFYTIYLNARFPRLFPIITRHERANRILSVYETCR